MDKSYSLYLVWILILFTKTYSYPQSPQGIPYQGVARNASGAILASQPIILRMSIHDVTTTGTVVYSETHAITTTSLGQFSITIGLGVPITGTLASINWAIGTKFLQVELSTNAGSSYLDMGTTQFLSVPYALNSGSTNWTKTGNNIYNINTGNLGIGTSTPNAKLNILGGDALINGVTVGRGGGSFDNNVALGNSALFNNTSGTQNVAIGFSSLLNNSNGIQNVAIGNESLQNNISGSNNTANGYSALYSNTTGNNNTANGYYALYSNTIGSNNTANGYQALYNNTTAGDNTAFGKTALYFNTTGSFNTAVSTLALYNNITGHDNTGIGYRSLASNTIGNYNTAYGGNALSGSITGNYNSACGKGSGSIADGGTFTGCASGASAGTNNTSSGYLSGNYEPTSGSFNISIGSAAYVKDNYSNSISLGINAINNSSNKVLLGVYNTSNGGQVNWTTFSDRIIKNNIQENVIGLDFINELRPVTYNFDIKKENKLLLKDNSKDWEGKYDIEKMLFSGFIAQDVEVATKKVGYDFSGIDKSEKLMSLRYSEFTIPLVKAVQELSKEYDILNEEMKELNLIKSNQQSKRQNAIVKLKNSNKEIGTPLLGQSIQNPFDSSMVLPFRIPKNCTTATIEISESNNQNIVATMKLSSYESHLTVKSGSLTPSKYNYTLIIDGKKIDSKQMEIKDLQ